LLKENRKFVATTTVSRQKNGHEAENEWRWNAALGELLAGRMWNDTL
jgi:hypothetical protein